MAGDMERIAANAGKPQRKTHKGREYLVTSATLIVPGVLNGSQGPLFYPEDEVAKDPRAWNHIPITVGHPTKNGLHVSGRDPDILEEHGIGYVYRAQANGKLTAEAWFDMETTRNYDRKHGTAILPQLERGEPVELSTGLFTDNHPGEGEHNGVKYTAVARNYRPDHLALLHSEKGACSVAAGCGFGVNVETSPVDSLLTELGGLFSVNVTDQVRSKVTGWFKQYGAGSGQGPAHAAAQDGAMTLTARDRELGAEAAKQFASTGHDLASWVADEGIWKRAKDAAQKYEADETYHAVVAHIYQKMGGGMKGEALNTENSVHREGDADMNRAATIAFLTTNCDCWKGKEKVLENKDMFTDDDLVKLKANVEKSQQQEAVANAARDGFKTLFGATDADLTLNAMPAFIKEKIKAKEDEDEDEESTKKKSKQTTNATSTKPAKPQTENEWFASAPPAIQAAVRNAMRLAEEERAKLMERLTANLDNERKSRLETRLQGKPLDELRELAELVPAPTTNQPDQSLFVPSYLGAAGGLADFRHDPNPELLDLPVMNAEMWAGKSK